MKVQSQFRSHGEDAIKRMKTDDGKENQSDGELKKRVG